jgi:hypothetical protein
MILKNMFEQLVADYKKADNYDERYGVSVEEYNERNMTARILELTLKIGKLPKATIDTTFGSPMAYCFDLESERIAWIPVSASKENVQDEEVLGTLVYCANGSPVKQYRYQTRNDVTFQFKKQ